MQFVSDQPSKGLGVISPSTEMVGNHKVKNMCGLEVLETPGQAGFLMVFCQFPWSMGGYHHL